ncbi:mediator of RNA polymerase II transcription subunit 24 isoform 6 [Camelus ferus]|nr:mediator of RNA polymerase II transcription subunit 24 isoform 6 [Camelus ferus]
MKVVNLKQAILQAWKERWSDYQWAINMKTFFPKGATWDILNLAEALLEQAMIGPSPKPLILSYLKYAISSQMVSCSSVLTAIRKFDDFSRDLCVQALLDIMDMFCDRLSCHNKAEECIGLCQALLSALYWLLHRTAASAERLRDGLEAGTPAAAAKKQLAMCLQRLEKTVSSTKNRALLYMAKLEEASSWTAIEHCLLKPGDILAGLSSPQLRSQAEQCGTLIRSIPTMLSVHSEQLHKTGFPTVPAVVPLAGTKNLTGERQPAAGEEQHMPTPPCALEPWKARFVGIIESPEGTGELKWTVFPFLKLPQVLVKLKKYSHGDKDFTEDVSSAFEFLLKLTPLLDKADQRCRCDCTSFLPQECSKQGLLSETSMNIIMAKLKADREHAPWLKSDENANLQPNPGLILCAEPTVTNILRTMDAATLRPWRGCWTSGSEVILSESSTGTEVFFETWLQVCMHDEGKILNPDHPYLQPDSTKVESLVVLLSNSSEMKLVQMKWHKACLSISVAILEILNTWENGVLAFESIQKITYNIKGKVCNVAVCAVAWLVTCVWMLELDEREKSLQMIRLLAGLLYSKNTLQFYNERVVIMSSILEHMCADALQQTATQIKFPSTGGDTMPYWKLLPQSDIKKVLMDVICQGIYWFCNNLIRELLKQMQKEHLLRVVELPYTIFCLDMWQGTLVLLGHILPSLLTDSSKWHSLMDPLAPLWPSWPSGVP